MASPAQQRHVVIACFLGWTLDAFDFFIMIFALGAIAHSFGTGITSVTWAITLTLAMRAVGALIFGQLADRFGRRSILIANVICFSILEFASGFAPTLAAFIVMRALFGIAMGGEWGVGASLTMESIPANWRGTVSGILQSGYSFGYLLAAILYGVAFPLVGWRGMFMLGALPGLLVIYIRASVPESPDWLLRRGRSTSWSILAAAARRPWLFVYAILVMTAFNLFSHSTQDLYPSAFLRGQHHFSVREVATVAVIYNIGAIIGCLSAGALSQRLGRRRTMILCAAAAILVLPLWAFASSPVWLGLGAFIMQFMVQGAFGVVPAHLNEMSPPEVRGTFPGFTYQLGNLFAAANATIQAMIAARMGHDYSAALAMTCGFGAVAIIVLIGLGREARHARMGAEAATAGAE
jgi:SHS family lactate transporter-like MFS transporter